eukprot:NODE_127_length_17034_cov_0.369590.p16 type:complete len:130 gc:universal NODE_127_length_17034_cov_0.369590:14697-14308(-)
MVRITYESKADQVEIFGSFNNWKEGLKMNQNEMIFEIEIDGEDFEFKFVVDGEWKCSESYPMKLENGVYNNYIKFQKVDSMMDLRDAKSPTKELYKTEPKLEAPVMNPLKIWVPAFVLFASAVIYKLYT